MLEFIYQDIRYALTFVRIDDYTVHWWDMIWYLQESKKNYIQYEG